ncbi:hypothetical protein PEBR_27303 [Penicillium brasilianum]|uniref:F-box domain-containing protein n=1 Tax=Penicillium brasilianum TaxID=104259 RepID=A0A1S9RWD6_PENBI|nr:hypothetical protein PEBR_27303 [Penicillium brasilianum]
MPPYLPFEIIRMIVSYIFDVETLLALRLVNGIWRAAVDEFPDYRLYVDIRNRNLDRFGLVTQNKGLRDKVRTLVWKFPDRPAVPAVSLISDRPTLLDELLQSIQRMGAFIADLRRLTLHNGGFLFPNLAHVAIHFRPPPVPQGRRLTCSPGEKLIHLEDGLNMAFMCLYGLSGLDEMSKSEHSRWILNCIISSQRKYVGLGANQQPVSSKILAFGLCRSRDMAIRGRDILEYLKLCGCGFTSDNTLSWILRHRGTLRSLKLEDCAIIFSMELGAWSPAEPKTAHVSIEFNGSKVNQCYRILWATWFQATANGLPRLRQFQFGSSRVRAPGEIGPVFRSEIPEGPKFGHTNKFLFGFFPDRYLEMKDGEGNFPWALRQGPRRRRKARPAADEGDLTALRRLLESIGQVVRENDTSSHAASVNNFIGSVEPN